jgi:hypothetical protein
MGMLTFTAGSQSITIDRPGYGYTVDIHMPIAIPAVYPLGYGTPFDAGSTYDYRILTIPEYLLSTTKKAYLNTFFRSAALGRCETVTLSLGVSASGFYPAGPDKGDVGDFTLRLLSQQQGGWLLSPWAYWSDALQFLIVSAPAYVLPSQVDQGPLQIGIVDGLRFPQAGFNPKSEYNYLSGLSAGGTPFALDGLEVSDFYESQWEQPLNHSNAAALVDYLVSTGRGNDIDIVGFNNDYIFGHDNSYGGTYSSLFLGSEKSSDEVVIKITHNHYNQFTIPLNWWMKERRHDLQDTDGAIEILQDTDSLIPVAWWKGEGNTDEEIIGLDAVWDGVPLYDSGFKIDFDTSLVEDDDYQLHVNNNSRFNFDPHSNFSIRFGIKIESGAILSNYWPIEKGSLSAASAPTNWGIAVMGAPNPEYYSIYISYNSINLLVSGQGIKDYERHDLLSTYSNGFWKLYIDGIEHSPSNIQRLIANTSESLRFAASWYGKAKCVIDNIKIYNEVIAP